MNTNPNFTTIRLTPRAAETFVRKSSSLDNGYVASWDGWTIVTFVPDKRAYTNRRGVYNRTLGLWGYNYLSRLTDSGKYIVRLPRAAR